MSPNSYVTYFGNFTLVLWSINIIPECNLFFKYLLYVMFEGIYKVLINKTYRRMIENFNYKDVIPLQGNW